MLNEIIHKYEFKLTWIEDGISVYHNQDICMRIIKESNIYYIKIDYIKTFNGWTGAWYENEIDIDNPIGFDIISKEIGKIIFLRDKAIIKNCDEDNNISFEVNWDILEEENLCGR